MLGNTLHMLARLRLARRALLLVDSLETCEGLPPSMPGGRAQCYWSSRLIANRPSDSGSMLRPRGVGWDWRHRFYEAKKAYVAALVRLGYAVLQADTDAVWAHDPFPALQTMAAAGAKVVVQHDTPLANAGMMYAAPGARSQLLLDELAWRIKLFQRHPSIVGRLVRFAKPPYYSNPDDQTLLNDVLLSFALRNRTFLGSTARLEARD